MDLLDAVSTRAFGESADARRPSQVMDTARRQTLDNTTSRGETLQQLVVGRLTELNISALQASKRAEGLCSYETLRAIARGEHKGRVYDRTAEGIARALQVPLDRVYKAAGIPTPGTAWDWPARFDRLNPQQRRLVEEVAAGLLEAYETGRRDSQDNVRRLGR